ncbi:sugar nucleotide-binding protein, partial [Patescibacteria group bacterium]|nr:sugar nucleotide-binding protein [Patescibacteria group bacterium]
METIIATGLSGMIGSRVEQFFSNQYRFVNLSLPKYDILNKKNIRRVFQEVKESRLVLHLAAFTDVNKAWEERGNKGGGCYRVNVLGTKNIVELCQEFQKYLIHVSTDFVFDGEKEGPYLENDQPHPIEWYGETKYMAEKIVSSNVADWAIARISFPYRARYLAKKDIVRRLIESFETGKVPPMFTDQITTLTFVDEIAKAFGVMFQRQPRGICHLVGSS